MASEIADKYGEWLASWSPSRRTVEARRSLAANRLDAWGLEGFTSETIQGWLGMSDFSAWSRATYYSHMIDFCAWLVAAGYLDVDPMPDVRKPKRPRSVPRPLSELEVTRVLATAQGAERDWVILGLLSGLRAHEIAKLRGVDVTETAIYVEGKGGVRAQIPTHPDIWAMAGRHSTVDYWFPGGDEGHVSGNLISQRVGKLFTGLGITGSVHRCRHTYGTRLIRAGVNIRIVQKLMRHASLATTEGYIDVSSDEMTEAIGRLTA